MQHQLIQNWSTLAMITDTDSKPHVFFFWGGGKSDYTHFGTTLFWLSTKKKKETNSMVSKENLKTIISTKWGCVIIFC